MHIQDRWYTKAADGSLVPKSSYGTTRRWQARYLAPDGRERSKTFELKRDAQRWLDEAATDMVTGRYVDPSAGRVTLKAFSERWLETRTFDPASRQTITPRVRLHIQPHLGDVELRDLRPSMIQAWLHARLSHLSPAYAGQVLRTLSSILSAAVEDGLIHSNPCTSSAVKAPPVEKRRIVPWSHQQVQVVVAAHPERWRALPIVAAGLGLRQGEAFGLRTEDVDFARHRVFVRRQVRLLNGRRVFAPPKGGKEREVPLPDRVAAALTEHLEKWPATGVTLPWKDVSGRSEMAELLFTKKGEAIDRNRHNRFVWRKALVAAGIQPTRETGMHALRHYYASALLEAGVSIRALAEYLGHHDPGFTLRTYAHMMPGSGARARQAIDAISLSSDGRVQEPRKRKARPRRSGSLSS